jgi:hypothetical protein
MMFKKLFNFIERVFSDMIFGHLARNAKLLHLYLCLFSALSMWA